MATELCRCVRSECVCRRAWLSLSAPPGFQVFYRGEFVVRSRTLNFIMGAAALVSSLCFPHRATAAIVTPTVSVTVTQSFAYASYGGGDFVFSTSSGASGCGNGWYIKATDPGYKAVVAAVLTAQVGGNFVLVYGDNADIWPGSTSGQYCRVQTVGITS